MRSPFMISYNFEITMKVAKTIPYGGSAADRTGVHRKTKMYMQDSITVWRIPIIRIPWSLKICHNPSEQDLATFICTFEVSKQ